MTSLKGEQKMRLFSTNSGVASNFVLSGGEVAIRASHSPDQKLSLTEFHLLAAKSLTDLQPFPKRTD
jgi:hypothetical protein